MDPYINLNGNWIHESEPPLFIENRSFRYGDGLFETMLYRHATIQLENYHFERLFAGMKILGLNIPVEFTNAYFSQQAGHLCVKNERPETARVRITFFRDGLEASLAHYVIETGNLPDPDASGLKTGLYTGDKKSTGILSNLKTNNYLLYVMAARHAKESMLDECFVLNQYDRICDSSISNVFVVKNGIIYTPPLTEGCIAGVMRRHLLQLLPANGFRVEEKPFDTAWLLNADEIFLTNVLRGIRSVQSFETTQYGDGVTAKVRHQLCNHPSS